MFDRGGEGLAISGLFPQQNATLFDGLTIKGDGPGDFEDFRTIARSTTASQQQNAAGQ